MNKVRMILKKYYFLISLMEILVFVIGSIQIGSAENLSFHFTEESFFADTADGRVYGNELDAEDAEEPQMLRTEEMYLDKGIYEISVKYSATDGGNINVAGDGKGPKSIWADSVGVSAHDTEKTFHIWANDPLERFRVQITSSGGTLAIQEIDVKTADNSKLYMVTCLFLKLFLFNALAAMYYYRKRLKKFSVEIMGIAGITLIASMGMLTRYMLPGHDLLFHLMRIEGLKDGLLSGAFPVRIQPNWCSGWGYAVAVMYGDTTLFLPAVMRILGFTVQTAYKTFVIAVNLLTAGIAYYSFYKICNNKYISLLGSLLFTAAPYRLCCIYIRGAFGEYTAMMFMPLVVLEFWYAFCEDTEDENYGKKIIAPIIGFSGLIQTHILTCQMAAIFIVLLCLINIRLVLRKKTFLYLAKTAVLTVIVNLWFLVPFIQYFGEELVCTEFKEMASDYQVLGVSLAELFAQEASGYYGYSWSELTSLANKFSIPLGNGLVLCAVSAILVLWNDRVKEKKVTGTVLIFGILSTWLATNLFPYHGLQVYFPKIAAFLAKPGLPYRYLSLACMFLSLLAVIVFWKTQDKIKQNLTIALFFVIAGTAVYQGLGFSYQTLYSGYYELHYAGEALNTTNLMGNEYLYQGTETWITEVEKSVTGQNVAIAGSNKEYNRVEVECRSEGDSAYIEAPVFYYPGYIAYDTGQGKEQFEITRGSNNRIRVLLPEDYEGTVLIEFKEPFVWRIAEIISAIGTIIIGIMVIFRWRRSGKTNIKEKSY